MTNFHHRSSQSRPAAKPSKAVRPVILGVRKDVSKADRINAKKQKLAHQAQLLKQSRKTSDTQVPLTVAVIPFHSSVNVAELWQTLMSLGSGEADLNPSLQLQLGMTTVALGANKTRGLQFVMPSDRSDIFRALDAAKTADVLLAVFPGGVVISSEQSCFDAEGYKLLTSLKLQGLPPKLIGLTFGRKLDDKSMRTTARFFESEFTADSKNHRFVGHFDTSSLRRQLALIHSEIPDKTGWRQGRGYMLIDHSEYDAASDTLAVRGFVKGTGFSAGSAVHLTGHARPFKLAKIACSTGEVIEAIEDEEDLLELTRPGEEGEQTWPTMEEELTASRHVRKVRVPAGTTTDVEVAWLGEDEGSVQSDWNEEEEEWPVQAEEEVEEPEEKLELRTREEMDLPDEVDTPTTLAAKVRFQKYRGLKSLRTSSWDPYEELPIEFSRIVEFDNPEATAKEGYEKLNQSSRAVQGKYCVMYLQGGQWQGSTQPLVLSSLLPFETKVTLMHCKMQRLAEVASAHVKSKDTMTIQCGFRRYETRPLFSEAIKSRSTEEKITKFFRHLPDGDTSTVVVTSFYGPTMFGSAPSLMFDAQGRLSLWGAVSSCQPSRPVILKRILLTGYVHKAHKRGAVIRYMFFSPSDILWYKPVELVTKKGLRGNIVEPLGTKGHMKCRFSAVLTHDDIVCLPLYKRVYPPWYPRTWGEESMEQ